MADVLIKDVNMEMYTKLKKHIKTQGKALMPFNKDLFERAMKEELKNSSKKGSDKNN